MKYLVKKKVNLGDGMVKAGKVIEADAKDEIVKAYVKSGALVKPEKEDS